MTGPIDTRLEGRERELEAVAEATRAVDGFAAVLISGDAGIGKTSIWRRAIQTSTSRGRRVMATTSVHHERDMPYAALEDLLGDACEDDATTVSAADRTTLRRAFRRADDDIVPDPRAVCVAALRLVESLCRPTPVTIAIDDVQWTDLASQQCLAYVARRLTASPVHIVLACRDHDLISPGAASSTEASPLVSALPHAVSVMVGALPTVAVRAILAGPAGVGLPPASVDWVVERSEGNPFWAVELGRAIRESSTGRSGTAHPLITDAPDLTRKLAAVDVLRRRLSSLGSDVVLLAALTAALRRPTPSAVVQAARKLGLDSAEDAVDTAESSGLVAFVGGRLVPSHPIVATALLANLQPFRRARVHRAAAGVASTAEERAVQLLAASETDGGPASGDAHRPELLEALDAATDSAEKRGAPRTAAAFGAHALEEVDRAAPGDRVLRLLRCAELAVRGSDVVWAADLLHRIGLSELDDSTLERVAPLLVEVIYRTESERSARAAIAAIADLPTPSDRRRRRVALIATLRADPRWAEPDRRRLPARVAEIASRQDVIPQLRHLALGNHIYERLDTGAAVGAGLIRERRALEAAMTPTSSSEPTDILQARALVRDDELGPAIDAFAAILGRCRADGDETTAINVGPSLAEAQLLAGRPAEAAQSLERVADHRDRRFPEPDVVLFVRARIALATGDYGAVDRLLSTARRGPEVAVRGRLRVALDYVAGQLAHQQGRPEEAATFLDRFAAAWSERGVHDPVRRFLVDADLAEVLIDLGDLDRAGGCVDRLSDAARLHPRALVRGVEDRVRALVELAHGDATTAAAWAQSAVEHHDKTPRRQELARSLLVLGDARRITGDATAARAALTEAGAAIEASGHRWLVDRHHRLARLLDPSAERGVLTAAERRVAELATHGFTNREVAARLFLSYRTVENHLRSIYRKLAIHSRDELPDVLSTTTDLDDEGDVI